MSGQQKQALGLLDWVPFGKYRGTPVQDVMHQDPAYITWLLAETATQLDNDAFRYWQTVNPEIEL